MSNIDEAIRRALSPEDVKAYEALGKDRSPFEEAFAAFSAQHRAFAIWAWISGALLFAAFAYASWRFAMAAEIRTMLIWGAIAAFAMFSMGMVKLWFWMEIQKNGVVRELKRLQLQIAALMGTAEG